MRYHTENKNRIYSYIDLHAHGKKKGCFFYGNALDYQRQIENVAFAKLVA
jgi:hypothetical protein